MPRVGLGLLSPSSGNAAVQPAAVRTQDSGHVDGNILANPLHQVLDLLITVQCPAQAFQPRVVHMLQPRPDHLEAVRCTSCRGLEQDLEARQLCLDLATFVSRMLAEAEMGARAVRILKRAYYLHQEALDLLDVSCRRRHEDLATPDAPAGRAEQGDSGRACGAMGYGHGALGRMPLPLGLIAALEGGLAHVDDALGALLLEAAEP